ncbi:hypothetical protein ISS30_08910 [bacterium]|nr:hypothetical protein [bacterium]
MAYKLKSAFRPSERKRREPEQIEPNLTPIMNLVVVLIPILLQVAVLVHLNRIDYNPPLISSAAEDNSSSITPEDPAKPTALNLIVNVIDTCIEVSIFFSTSGENYWEIPLLPDGSYDYAALQDTLLHIKKDIIGEPIRRKTTIGEDGQPFEKEIYKLEDADIVRISCRPDLPYQEMVSLLDVTCSIIKDSKKEWLFPQPVLMQQAMVAVSE